MTHYGFVNGQSLNNVSVLFLLSVTATGLDKHISLLQILHITNLQCYIGVAFTKRLIINRKIILNSRVP